MTGVDLDGFERTVGTGAAKRRHRYRRMEGVPVKDGKEALLVNWLTIEIARPNGEVTCRNGFVTNLPVNRQTVVDLATCGRARWKIENDTFNVLKNNGHRLEHTFGHGQNTLASVPVALNLPAFATHNACDLVAPSWQQARRNLGARNRLFTHIWSITADHVFRSWHALMRTIITAVPPPRTA